MDIMQQFLCLVVNQIMVYNYVSLRLNDDPDVEL